MEGESRITRAMARPRKNSNLATPIRNNRATALVWSHAAAAIAAPISPRISFVLGPGGARPLSSAANCAQAAAARTARNGNIGVK